MIKGYFFIFIILLFGKSASAVNIANKETELTNCSTQECAEYFQKFKVAASRGHIEAYAILGQFYYNGYGVEQSEVQALKYFKKAAKYGDSASQYKLGLIYLISKENLNATESIKYLKKASFRHYKDAKILLGILHFNNQFIEQDFEISDSYLIKAYRDEHPKIPDVINTLKEQGLFTKEHFPMLVTASTQAREAGELVVTKTGSVEWPKDDGMEVITVISPPITELLDKQLLSLRKQLKATGSRLRGRLCTSAIGCNMALGRSALDGFPASFLGVSDATGSGGLTSRSFM